MNLKEQILSAKVETQKVNVPQWNVDVYLKVLSAWDRFSLWQYIETKGEYFSLALLARSLADENGNRIFTDSEEDLKALADKENAVIEQLALLAMKLNKMTEDSKEEVKKN